MEEREFAYGEIKLERQEKFLKSFYWTSGTQEHFLPALSLTKREHWVNILSAVLTILVAAMNAEWNWKLQRLYCIEGNLLSPPSPLTLTCMRKQELLMKLEWTHTQARTNRLTCISSFPYLM